MAYMTDKLWGKVLLAFIYVGVGVFVVILAPIAIIEWKWQHWKMGREYKRQQELEKTKQETKGEHE
jgi:hypothetical protein